MTIKARTVSGKMPPRNADSWRKGLLEKDLSELESRAEAGDLCAQKRLEMLGKAKTKGK